MARRSAKPPAVADGAPPMAFLLAQRLRAGLERDADFAVDDLPAETGGAVGPGAMFHVTGGDGRLYRVRVIQQTR